jgi:hypothetical protein
MSTLGIFWICSVIVSYGVGLFIGAKLFKKKRIKKSKKPRFN